MFASKNFLDLLREEMKDPSFREGFKDALVEHAIIENIDLCGRRPLRDQNLEVCRFADGYRLTGTQIIAIDSKPNIKVRTGVVVDRTARKISIKRSQMRASPMRSSLSAWGFLPIRS